MKDLKVMRLRTVFLTVLAVFFCLKPIAAQGADVSTWAGLQTALSAGGTVTLTQDILAESTDTFLTVPAGVTADLDLNGHILSRNLTAYNMNGQVLRVSGSLTISDSSPSAPHTPAVTYTDPVSGESVTVTGGIITGANAYEGGAIRIDSTGAVTLSGGSVACNTASYGGGIYADGGSVAISGGTVAGNTVNNEPGGGIYMTNAGTLNMSAGKVTGNSGTGDYDGGGIYLRYGSSFTLSGGEITNNKHRYGGGVSIYDNVTFTMTGGTISNNVATDRHGGGVQLAGGTLSFLMSGGEISGNTAGGEGGGVHAQGSAAAAVTLSGNAVIKNNTAGSSGGGVYVTSGSSSLAMSDTAAIENNSCTNGNGGGVYGGSTVITVTDNARISGNTASGGGGGIDGGNITLSGNAAVSNNTCASGYHNGGGGICTGGTVNISENASITGNACTDTGSSWGGGGGIFNSSGTITMTGGTIANNTCGKDGGGVALYYYGILDMSGGSITGNSAGAGYYGGGVYNEDYDDGKLRFSGAPVVSGNTVTGAAGESNIINNGHSGAKKITVAGPFTSGAHIGYSARPGTNPTASSPILVTNDYSTHNTGDPALYFFSDQGYTTMLKDGQAVFVTPWQALETKLAAAAGGTVVLTEDLKALPADSSIKLANGGSAILDLNGHILDAAGLCDGVISSRGSLTIIDSNPGAAHTPAVTYTNPVTGGTETVTGGILTGSTGRGFWSSYNSTTEMNGGTIVGNAGSGVYVAGSTFTMNGGSICGNAAGNGGGVNVYESGTFILDGGTIRHNTASGKGGGVYLYNNQSSYSRLYLKSGSITENTAVTYGGGVQIDSRGTLYAEGDPVVSGNTAGTGGNNVNPAGVNVTGAFTSGASIGVTPYYGWPAAGSINSITSGYATHNGTADPAAYFVSDNSAYAVVLDGSEAGVKLPLDVTVTPAEHMTKTSDSGAASQTGLTGAMTPVVYTADEGYYFPAGYSVAKVNGIQVTRDSFTEITVSGTPTNHAAITLTAPTEKTKEAVPAAVFTADGPESGVLSSVAAGMKYSLDGGTSWTDIDAASVAITSGVTAANGILVYQPSTDTNTRVDSDRQTIAVTKAAAPALTAVQPAVIGGTGSIPTTTAHEFSTDGTTFAACAGETAGLAPGTYYVRTAASGTVLASDPQTITILSFDPAREPTPAAAFTADGTESGVLSSVAAGMKYSLDGGTVWTAITGTTETISAGVTTENGIQVYQPGNGTTTADSLPQTITVTRMAVPSGLSVTACTTSANDDGTITGTDSSMEYQLSGDSAWTAVTGASITGLSDGTYLVRVKASGAALTSDPATVVVPAWVAPVWTVSFAANGGGGSMSSVNVTEGSWNLPVCTFTPPGGQMFEAWTVGGTDYDEGDPVSITADTVVTAKWAAIPPHVHSFTSVAAVPADCETAGNKLYYVCSGCGKWYEDALGLVEITDRSSVVIPATGHRWDSGTVVTEPTETAAGLKVYSCLNDSAHTRSEVLPAKGSSGGVVYVPDDNTDYVDPPARGGSGASGSRGSGGSSVKHNGIYTGASGSSVSSGGVSGTPAQTGGGSTAAGPGSAFADADGGTSGGWLQDEEGWHFLNAGEEFRGGWAYLPYQGESRWYAFDDGGVMLTGWYRREESVYYLNPVSDGTQGAMLTGWQFIDGNWYYFEPDPGKDQGHLYRNTVTPDGYTVDETGAWTGR